MSTEIELDEGDTLIVIDEDMSPSLVTAFSDDQQCPPVGFLFAVGLAINLGNDDFVVARLNSILEKEKEHSERNEC